MQKQSKNWPGVQYPLKHIIFEILKLEILCSSVSSNNPACIYMFNQTTVWKSSHWVIRPKLSKNYLNLNGHDKDVNNTEWLILSCCLAWFTSVQQQARWFTHSSPSISSVSYNLPSETLFSLAHFQNWYKLAQHQFDVLTMYQVLSNIIFSLKKKIFHYLQMTRARSTQ